MIRRPRLKLRTLMLAIAFIALVLWAVPPWWRWHHEMLERSRWYTLQAASDAGRADLYSIGAEMAIDSASSRAAGNDPTSLLSEAQIARHYADFNRKNATYPWLGSPVDR